MHIRILPADSGPTWRLIVHGAAAGAFNMAVDEALFEGVQAGGRPVLRLYRWNPPAVSLGRNQPARGVFDAPTAAGRGIGIVRRPTGGMAVYHDCELTYAVIVPAGLLGGPRATYAAVNRGIARGLRTLGVPATTSPAGITAHRTRMPHRQRGPHPCFQEAAAGEVMVHGRKLVGSAQHSRRRAILQHGSILVSGDQAEVLELLHTSATESLAPACTSLAAVLGRAPDWCELEQAVTHGIAHECDVTFQAAGLSAAERRLVAGLEAHHRSPEWTWRL